MPKKNKKYDYGCWWQSISLEKWNLISEFFAIICFYHVFTFFGAMKTKTSLVWFLYIASIIGFIFNILVILVYIGISIMNTFCQFPMIADAVDQCFFFQDWDLLLMAFSMFQIFYQGLFGTLFFGCAALYGMSLVYSIMSAGTSVANEALGGDMGDAGQEVITLVPVVVLCCFCIAGFLLNTFFTCFTFFKYFYPPTYTNAIRCKRIYPVKYVKGNNY